MLSPRMKSCHTLEEEIRAVQKYLESESELQQGKLTREFYLDPDVDTGTVVPGGLLQVFIENSLRNYISNGHSDAFLHISVNRSNLGILVMVADSGTGNGTSHREEYIQSEGIKLLNSYLPVFNRQHPVSISYKILNLNAENGSPGSRVLITIKS